MPCLPLDILPWEGDDRASEADQLWFQAELDKSTSSPEDSSSSKYEGAGNRQGWEEEEKPLPKQPLPVLGETVHTSKNNNQRAGVKVIPQGGHKKVKHPAYQHEANKKRDN